MRKKTAQRMHGVAPWVCFVLCALVIFGGATGSYAAPVYPEASGENVVTAGKVTMDISHMDLGYIMVKHSGSSKKLKVQVNCDGAIQNYDLNGKDVYEVYPLIKGSGTYKISVLENSKGSDYVLITSNTLDVVMADNNAAFLCPNQFIWYEPETLAVQKSIELCEGLTNEWEKAEKLYTYVSQYVMYDYMKMLTVRNPYLPDVDDTLLTGMGICFDYSALLACMLRVQGIPTMMVVGDLLPTGERHAWNKALLGGNWMMMDATFSTGGYTQADYAEQYYY